MQLLTLTLQRLLVHVVQETGYLILVELHKFLFEGGVVSTCAFSFAVDALFDLVEFVDEVAKSGEG